MPTFLINKFLHPQESQKTPFRIYNLEFEKIQDVQFNY